MRTTLSRTLLFALYQLSLLTAIVLLPVALVLRRAGITLPAHRLVSKTERAYATRTDNTA